MDSAVVTPPNNGMHPTPHHVASHVRCVGARVMPGVGRLILKGNEKMLEAMRQLLAYDGWANARILAALSSTSDQHQKALHLLAHLLVSQKIWLLRLKGEDTSTINKSPEMSYAECGNLAEENQQECVSLLSSLSEAKLNSLVTYRNFKGTEFHTPVGEILLHVAIHGTYHRGQIALAMRGEGGIPADTDFITFVRERGVG